MTTVLVITIILAAIMTVAAVVSKRNCHHLIHEMNGMKAQLNEYELENRLLRDTVTRITKEGGISEASVLSIISEISRIDNNLYRMDDVPGRKQIKKALERIKSKLQAEDYTIVPLIGTPYKPGMQVTAVFMPDENLQQGESVIISVQKPQVNRAGRMIQAASVTVGQNE